MEKLLRALAVLCAVSLTDSVLAIEEGKPAPKFEARLLDGKPFSLADANGKVVILNFWATWCAPCRQEMPAFEAYYRKHKDEGVEIVAISMDRPVDDAKVDLVMRQFSYPAALVRNASFKDYGRIWTLPLTFVIDRNGILRKDEWQPDPPIDLPALEKLVTPLLTKP